MHVDIKDDTRQAYVITKNEIKKFMVGKKIILFGILVVALEVLNLVVPYVWGEGYSNSTDAAGALLGNINLFIVIAAILFMPRGILGVVKDAAARVRKRKEAGKDARS